MDLNEGQRSYSKGVPVSLIKVNNASDWKSIGLSIHFKDKETTKGQQRTNLFKSKPNGEVNRNNAPSSESIMLINYFLIFIARSCLRTWTAVSQGN